MTDSLEATTEAAAPWDIAEYERLAGIATAAVARFVDDSQRAATCVANTIAAAMPSWYANRAPVSEAVRSGWAIGDRTLRPALVIVARRPDPTAG